MKPAYFRSCEAEHHFRGTLSLEKSSVHSRPDVLVVDIQGLLRIPRIG